MSPEEFKALYPNIPNQPGIYKYFNQKKKVIYVGKAKNLKKRVSQYFMNRHQDGKTRRLVSDISYIEFNVVPNENDALLLENNLIKTHRPQYNINLKDDKTYPFILIHNEPFPRVFLTRQFKKTNAEFYGPYTNVSSAYDVINFISDYFKLRTCNLDLSPNKIAQHKYKPCLQFHIKKCKAPCIGLQSTKEYDEDVEEVRQILNGKTKKVSEYFKSEMQKAIEKLNFERAEEYNQKLTGLEKFNSKSIIVSQNIKNIDVLEYAEFENALYFTYFQIENGLLIRTHQQAISKKMDEDNRDIFLHMLLYLRTTYNSVSDVVISSEQIDIPDFKIKIEQPQIGDKKKLLQMAQENTKVFLEKSIEDKKNTEIKVKSRNEILDNIQTYLSLDKKPEYIECFDNSNIQGTSPVAAMVCFRDGLPSKKDYRMYHIKTVEGPDDFASMQEVVYRRYSRLLAEDKELPDLVIIDGGKGQLNAAMKAIEKLDLQNRMTLVGLAKKKEEIYLYQSPNPIQLPMNSAELNLIRFIRDEVHRFGITFHRKTRSKTAQKSALDSISGIGPSTKQKLLKHYKTISNIKNASFDELANLIGKQKAELIKQFQKNKN